MMAIGEYYEDLTNNLLQKLFGIGEEGSNSFHIKSSISDQKIVDCNVGILDCTAEKSGLGLVLETKKRVDLLLGDIFRNQRMDEKNSSNSYPVCTVECSITQSYSLVNELYFECASDHKPMEQNSPTIDLSEGFIRVKVLPPQQEIQSTVVHDPKPFGEDDSSLKECSVSEVTFFKDDNAGLKGVSLSEVVSQIETNGTHEECTETDFLDREIAVGSNVYRCDCLGIKSDEDQKNINDSGNFEVVPVDTLLITDKVVSVSCSLCHTLLLTSFGCVLSCGDSSDGQLGHNSYSGCKNFKQIDWFVERKIFLSKISAGADQVRSHSAAISSNGILFTWGHAAICGHGADVTKLSNSARKSSSSYSRQKDAVLIPRPVAAFENMDVLRVSCGGSFTVALVQQNSLSTSIYCWGANPNLSSNSYPTQVSGLDDIVEEVSAGSSHALALSKHGSVFSWGSNSYGECSASSSNANVDPDASLWDTVSVPREVPGFGPNNPARSVAAGCCLSGAVDTRGRTWKWGKDSCMHDSFVNGPIDKFAGDSSPSTYTRSVLSGYLRPPKNAIPQLVQSLESIKATKVALGENSGLAITESGKTYTWGLFDDKRDPGLNVQNTLPIQALAGVSVFDGDTAGKNVIFLTQGPSVRDVGSELWQQRCPMGENSEFQDSYDDWNKISRLPIVDQSLVALIVGIKKVYCHKVLLTSRSSVLQELILAEQEITISNTSAVVELYLTDIAYETAIAMVYYMYFDTICLKHVASPSLTRNLMIAAKKYSLNRLSEICKEILDSEKPEQSQSQTSNRISPTVMASDLAMGINDTNTADLCLRTLDGGFIYVNKSILETQSSFYSSFHATTSNEISTINVPCTYESTARLVMFIYTGMIASIEQNHLLEDITNARRFGMREFTLRCECLISVNNENFIGILRFALDNNLNRLKRVALVTLAKNLGSYFRLNDTLPKDLGFLKESYPRITSELFEVMKEGRGPMAIIPKERVNAADKQIEKMKAKRKTQIEIVSKEMTKGISQKSGIALFFLMASSTTLFSHVPSGPWTIILNSSFSFCLLLLYFL